jgi:hypothetical protein
MARSCLLCKKKIKGPNRYYHPWCLRKMEDRGWSYDDCEPEEEPVMQHMGPDRFWFPPIATVLPSLSVSAAIDRFIRGNTWK